MNSIQEELYIAIDVDAPDLCCLHTYGEIRGLIFLTKEKWNDFEPVGAVDFIKLDENNA